MRGRGWREPREEETEMVQAGGDGGWTGVGAAGVGRQARRWRSSTGRAHRLHCWTDGVQKTEGKGASAQQCD